MNNGNYAVNQQVPRVIVIGGNHHNTLGAIRGLGRKGVMSIVILHSNVKDNYVLKSKYILDSCIVKDENELLETLLKFQSAVPVVVICTSDFSASVIDRNHDLLKDYFYLPGCEEQGLLTKNMDKVVMSSLAKECGLRIPQTQTINCANVDLSKISFPCITKPLVSFEGKKSDIIICNNQDELEDYLCHITSGRLLVQDYIEKESEYQLIGLANNGEFLIPGKTVILTQSHCSNTGFLHYVKLDGTEPIKECKLFLEKSGFSGLFSMEFIRDHYGNDYFMEINYRNDGNAISVIDAGVNLPYIWYQSCIDSEFSINNTNAEIRELYVIPEYNEILLWYEGKLGFISMLRDFFKTDSYMEFDPDDLAPTSGKLGMLRLMLQCALRKPLKDVLRFRRERRIKL